MDRSYTHSGGLSLSQDRPYAHDGTCPSPTSQPVPQSGTTSPCIFPMRKVNAILPVPWWIWTQSWIENQLLRGMVKPRRRRETNLVTAKKTKLTHTSNNRLLTWLDTEQIQHHVTKIQQEYIVCDTISSKIQRRRRQKEMSNNSFFTRIRFQFSCGFAGTIQVLRLKIPKTQCVWIDWARNPKLQLLPLVYGACVNPGSVKVSASALYPLLETLRSTMDCSTSSFSNSNVTN